MVDIKMENYKFFFSCTYYVNDMVLVLWGLQLGEQVLAYPIRFQRKAQGPLEERSTIRMEEVGFGPNHNKPV